MPNAFLFNSIIIILSLLIVAKSADLLVYGISDYAKKLGISDYLTGFIVVSIGTALPEFVASVTGASLGHGTIVFGTILGSNLFKIPLLGIVVLVLHKTIKTKSDIGSAPIVTLFMAVVPIFLIADNVLSRIDGVFLLFLFSIYIFKLWHGEGELGKIKKDVELRHIWKSAFIFLGTLIALLLAARWLVFSSIELAKSVGISPYFIGLIVIGLGASAPEFMVQIRSVYRKHHHMALGNVLGSIVANSTLVLGITALITPFTISIRIVWVSYLFLAIGLFYLLLNIHQEKITYKHGIVFILIYIAYLMVEFLF